MEVPDDTKLGWTGKPNVSGKSLEGRMNIIDHILQLHRTNKNHKRLTWTTLSGLCQKKDWEREEKEGERKKARKIHTTFLLGKKNNNIFIWRPYILNKWMRSVCFYGYQVIYMEEKCIQSIKISPSCEFHFSCHYSRKANSTYLLEENITYMYNQNLNSFIYF